MLDVNEIVFEIKSSSEFHYRQMRRLLLNGELHRAVGEAGASSAMESLLRSIESKKQRDVILAEQAAQRERKRQLRRAQRDAERKPMARREVAA